MSGYYIIPSGEGFLPISGGTVTGATYFASGVSASTIYIDSGITVNNSLNQVLVYNNITNQIEYRDVGTIGVQNLNTLDIIEFDTGTTTISTLYNTTVPDATNSILVGGALPRPASDWKTYNMVQVLDLILFPTLNPTYSIPTLSLSSDIIGIKEIGSTISPNLTLQGTKNDAGFFTNLSFVRIFNSSPNPLASFSSLATATTTNIPPQYGFNDPNNPNLRFTATYQDSNYVVPAPPSPSSYFSSTVYRGNSVYLSGLTKQDNKGVFDTRPYLELSVNNPQAGSSNLASNNITIVGLYPVFYGTATTQPSFVDVANAISSNSAKSLLVDAQGTITIDWSSVGVFHWFAHYALNTTKTKYFESSFNSGNIGLSTDLFPAPTIHNVNSPFGYWSNIPYKIYISNFPTTTTAPPNTTPNYQLIN